MTIIFSKEEINTLGENLGKASESLGDIKNKLSDITEKLEKDALVESVWSERLHSASKNVKNVTEKKLEDVDVVISKLQSALDNLKSNILKFAAENSDMEQSAKDAIISLAGDLFPIGEYGDSEDKDDSSKSSDKSNDSSDDEVTMDFEEPEDIKTMDNTQQGEDS